MGNQSSVCCVAREHDEHPMLLPELERELPDEKIAAVKQAENEFFSAGTRNTPVQEPESEPARNGSPSPVSSPRSTSSKTRRRCVQSAKRWQVKQLRSQKHGATLVEKPPQLSLPKNEATLLEKPPQPIVADLEMNFEMNFAEGHELYEHVVQVYSGTVWHPSFTHQVEIAVTLYNGMEGSWNLFGEMEYIIATWEGERFVISNGSTLLTGVVDEQGIISGQVLQSGIQDGGFVICPNHEATWNLVNGTPEVACQPNDVWLEPQAVEWAVGTFEGYDGWQGWQGAVVEWTPGICEGHTEWQANWNL